MSDFQPNLFQSDAQGGPVECLGITFESDEARREYFLEILRGKLKDPDFRKIEGFPIGEDEDILALSDPPYYTACPNPFLGQIVELYQQSNSTQKDHRHVNPFVSDITEGKGEHFYGVHTYHTKVPYRAIARFILHYTYPGEVILDGFCGTGMTGLAVQACSDKKFVTELDSSIKPERIGQRLSILSDLSPAATHIAENYNSHVNLSRFSKECHKILSDFQRECGWMFKTIDPDTNQEALVDYYVWSDVFSCPDCGYEIVFWEQGVDQKTGYKKNDKILTCPSCLSENQRDKYERVEETYFDEVIGGISKKQKEKLVLVAYKVGKKQKKKVPDKFDFQILNKVQTSSLNNSLPVYKMMRRDGVWGDMYRAGYHLGISYFHHFYYRRTLQSISWFWDRISLAPIDIQKRLRWWLQSVSLGHTRLNRYFTSSYSQVNRYLKGFLYIAQVRSEISPWYSLTGKIKKMAKEAPGNSPVVISTASATSLAIQDSSVDYIFTDPPFGGNIIYSELNFMWEAWLKVFTNQNKEAIISNAQQKGLDSYQYLMELCFAEYYRVLKPEKWITILFHNSKNFVWIAIQSALEKAGFIVADVRVFDKKQLTMKQQTAAGTVQKDLIITAYKPSEDFERKFLISAGSEEGVWEFVKTHLKQLPVFINKNNKTECIAERQARLLFDRMIAFHVQRRVTFPTSASEFYTGLDQRFPQRDGMYFLSEQVVEYDRKRMTVKEMLQLDLFVNDESTAVQWLRQQLTKKPQTFQELNPQYFKATGGWANHEQPLELSDLLKQNFLRYDDGNIPKQIISWLAKSSTHRTKLIEILGSNTNDIATNLLDAVPDIGLETKDNSLIAVAKDRWYIPDPNRAIDLEKLREKSLFKEFEEYRNTKKKLKVFRMEAMRVGFKHYFQQREYKTIIEVARKIPERILQEDQKLLMFYDNAVTRAGED